MNTEIAICTNKFLKRGLIEMTSSVILSKGPKIVVIGGGTGLSVLLRGLKKYTGNITAIVTVADDGGGSGVLRDDLGMLPPGDIRSCLLALANTEPTMENLIKFRFSEGILKGQNFGNLLLAAMNEIYGSFDLAIKELSNVLAVTGKVLPVTLDDINLSAELENGRVVVGESYIPQVCLEEGTRIRRMSLTPDKSYPLGTAIESIANADLIVLGPGSLYTSVIPNLLVENMVESIYTAKAPTVYISNIMTQPGETTGFGVYDHTRAVLDHSKVGILDYVIGNTGSADDDSLKRYNIDGSSLVKVCNRDEEKLREEGIILIKEDLVEIEKDYIRHDNDKLSQLLVGLAKTRIFKRK